MTSVSVCSPSRPWQSSLFSTARLLRGLGVSTAGLFLLTAAWVLVRRLGGALQEPLPSSALLFLGGLLGCTLVAAVLLERGTRLGVYSGENTRWPVSRVLLTLAAVTLGVAVSLPQGPGAALCGFWLLVLAGAVAAWSSVHRSICRQAGPPGAERKDEPIREGDAAVLDGECERTWATEWEADEETDPEQQLLPEHVLQRVTRARDERGSELVFGTVRCDFVTGQRQQSIHLAFCPPLAALAHFVVDQVDGPAVQLRTVVAQTFGVSLEAKLAAPSREPVEVQIQFFAFEKPPDGEGA